MSFRDMQEMLRDLTGQEVVYKADVDLAKQRFSRAFDKARDDAKAPFLGQPHETRSVPDSDLYYELPLEARHWYGKKFSAILEKCPESAFKDAVASHRNRWRPLFNELQALIARQVKGRKPKPKVEPENTRTQFRAICPCCFREQAVKGTLMVAHGYTLKFGFQNGNCGGVNHEHFGTEAGLNFAQRQVVVMSERAAKDHRTAQKIRSGEIVPKVLNRAGDEVENPTKRQIEAQAYMYEGHARQAEHYVEFANGMIAVWAKKDPISVQVPV